ncbi:MAG TPA: glutathione S-transferase family protein [Polyangiaceae bacterium]|nr:glutathione S-transferase family protein [Polyangiaceae bacterium]
MKLYRFRYSPYARKVQMLLDLLGHSYELIEVSYTERSALAELTNGYVYVPVLQVDAGNVICDSRAICEELLRAPGAGALLPAPLEGPIWAYHDFADGPLEDVMFRIGSPAVRDAWPTAGERALYTLIKERKFGAGCIDAWQRARPVLIGQAQRLLAPTLSTLRQCAFLFGDRPTLADAALYGLCVMLEESEPGLLVQVSPALVDYARRVEGAAQLASTSGASAKR